MSSVEAAAPVHTSPSRGMEGLPEMRSIDMEEADLEGEIGGGSRGGGGSDGLDTLDEPVWDTVKRDLYAVGRKFGHVVFPRGSRDSLLREWDLWGPLFICVFISLLLEGSSQGAPQFTQVFSLTFFGAVAVTANCQLLGGSLSFFQALCVLGYCLLPPALAALLCSILLSFAQTGTIFALRLGLAGLGFVWATAAATAFLAHSQPPRRKALGVYPIGLFYFIVSWLIVSHSHYGH